MYKLIPDIRKCYPRRKEAKMLTQDEIDIAATQTIKDMKLAERRLEQAVGRGDLNAMSALKGRIKNDEVILDCIYKVKMVFSEETSMAAIMRRNKEGGTES